MARGSGGKDRTPPSVTITSPIAGVTIAPNTPFTFTANATDNRGIQRVELRFGGNTIVDTTAPYSATFTTPSVTGSFSLTALAYDTSGNNASHTIFINVGTSTTTTTTITPPPPPPTLPASKILATPPIVNQGGEGSCAAQSAALAYSIEKYYTTSSTSYSQSTNIMSPEWIYNMKLTACGTGCESGNTCLPPYSCSGETCTWDYGPSCYTMFGCGAGISILGSLNFLRSVGVCRWSLCPYSDLNGCSAASFTQTMMDDANLNKITKNIECLTSDIYTMKRLLVNNHGLIFNVQYDSNFYNSTCGYIWNSRGSLLYTHAMVIVGYDNSKNAWLVQNSWGSNWGCNGQIWVDYNFFASIVPIVHAVTTRQDLNYYPIL